MALIETHHLYQYEVPDQQPMLVVGVDPEKFEHEKSESGQEHQRLRHLGHIAVEVSSTDTDD